MNKNQMKNAQNTMNVFLLKHKMSATEIEALLVELIGCYVSKKPSKLMEHLLENDFDKFCALVSHMNEVGEKLKQKLKEMKGS